MWKLNEKYLHKVAFLKEFISFFLNFSINFMNGFSHVYIFITFIPIIISFISFILLSVLLPISTRIELPFIENNDCIMTITHAVTSKANAKIPVSNIIKVIKIDEKTGVITANRIVNIPLLKISISVEIWFTILPDVNFCKLSLFSFNIYC